MDAQKRLDQMLQDMELALPLYKPTEFWRGAQSAITDDLRARGFDTFRSHVSANRMYVPTFKDTNEAERDYLVFRASELPRSNPRLSLLSESPEGSPGARNQAQFDGRYYSKSFLNYLRGLNFLKQHVNISGVRSVWEIGGGYGTLGEICLETWDDAFYMNVDIPPVAAVSTWYLSQLFGENAIFTYEKAAKMTTIDTEEIRKHYRGMVICPWQLPRVVGKFDLFANFISFQEMEPDVVANYAKLVQPLTSYYVLLRNSRSGKVGSLNLEGGTVLRATTTDDMVSMFDQFKVLGRDSRVFGSWDPLGRFDSEVICMESTRASAA